MALKDMVRKVELEMLWRTILLMGRSGVGKTRALRALLEAIGEHRALKVLYCSTESKLTSIADLITSGVVEPVTIEEFSYPDPTDPATYSVCLNSPKKNLYQVIYGVRTEEHDYDVLFIDSVMRWMMKCLWKIARENTNADARSDYAIFKRLGLNMLDALGACSDPTQTKRPVHVIGTCGLEMELDPLTGGKKQMAAVDGTKIAPMIAHFFDDVLVYQTRAGAEGTEYIAHTRANPEFDAKVSGEVTLPPVIVNPDLHRILLKLQGRL